MGLTKSGLIIGVVLKLNIEYDKSSKITNTSYRIFTGQKYAFMQLFLLIPSGMANSVDPDQPALEGAVTSGSTLFSFSILSETLEYKLLGHTVIRKKTLGTDKTGLNSGVPASILRKSTSGRHRPVSYPDGPMTALYIFT